MSVITTVYIQKVNKGITQTVDTNNDKRQDYMNLNWEMKYEV